MRSGGRWLNRSGGPPACRRAGHLARRDLGNCARAAGRAPSTAGETPAATANPGVISVRKCGYNAWVNFFAEYLRRASACVFVGALIAEPLWAQSQPQLIQLGPARLWQRTEFQILNPPPASNPFDPEVIRLDAEFTLPSGRLMTVPAFWYQPYQRGLSSGRTSMATRG